MGNSPVLRAFYRKYLYSEKYAKYRKYTYSQKYAKYPKYLYSGKYVKYRKYTPGVARGQDALLARGAAG